jgi:hypothetical protein
MIPLSLYLLVLLWMAYEMAIAPHGYEDRDGYHDGREP